MKNNPKTPTISANERPRWKTVLFSAALLPVSLAVVAAIVVVLEIAVRLDRGALFSTEKVGARQVNVTRGAMAVHDPDLGHVPTPNLRGVKAAYGATVTTDAAGVRQNGLGSPPPGVAILAVGDSFTFGLEVDDDGSWPAQLERRVQRPVLNAGVFGYGLDQIVLRAEQLVVTRDDVDLVILAVFGDDIDRCEYSYRFASKPYFKIRDGRLELRNVPVPDGHTPVQLASLRSALEYSHLADVLLTRVAPNWWLIEGRERHEHERGDEVASLLLERWSGFARRRDLRTLYVALLASAGSDSSEDTARLGALTNHAKRVGLEVLDLSRPLWEMIQADKDRWQATAGHLTREGNDWVAAQIAAWLESSPTLGDDWSRIAACGGRRGLEGGKISGTSGVGPRSYRGRRLNQGEEVDEQARPSCISIPQRPFAPGEHRHAVSRPSREILASGG